MKIEREKRMRLRLAALVVIGLIAGWMQPVDAAPPDTILINGKIVTVDDQFSVVQALAIAGGRIAATGRSETIRRLAGPATRIIDLKGRTVVPGLIDNHAHYMRAAEYWDREVRLDGVTSHKRALDMIAAKARAAKPGEWVLVLGGWAEEQFTDVPRGFTKAELDTAAPQNPVAVQLIYNRIYANTAALQTLKIDANTPDPRGGKIEKDASGQPTGVLNGGGAVGWALAQLGEVSPEAMKANARLLLRDLNSVGITAFHDMGGRGFQNHHVEPFRALWREHALTARVFYNFWQEPANAADVEIAVAAIAEMKPFRGDDWFNQTSYGETVYFPLHDNLLSTQSAVNPEGLEAFRRVAQAVANRGLHLFVHAQLEKTISAFLNVFEAIDRTTPLKGLHWTLVHADQITPEDIERLRRLGMDVQLHSRPDIQGVMIAKVHGARAMSMPPLRMVQDSGLAWGLGSDATAVTPVNPFYALWWAVTGKMIGGRQVLSSDQTISRAEALIAHTRGNTHFLFEDANLGSLSPGKYADLVVLDRDYMKVPADQIKDIRPVLTMVGGTIVYEASRGG
jgi:predicted amidohydrolase YtcJ